MEIGEILREQDIVIGMAPKGKRSALARIAAWLGQQLGVREGAVLAALLRRERLGSTSIGHSVAIPHARFDGIAAPAAMLATLQRPISYDSPDGDPVDLLLTLLWPKADIAGFLPALAHLCRLLGLPELRSGLRASGTPEEALAWIGSYDARCARELVGRPHAEVVSWASAARAEATP